MNFASIRTISKIRSIVSGDVQISSFQDKESSYMFERKRRNPSLLGLHCRSLMKLVKDVNQVSNGLLVWQAAHEDPHKVCPTN